jgi:hypothetical protein
VAVDRAARIAAQDALAAALVDGISRRVVVDSKTQGYLDSLKSGLRYTSKSGVKTIVTAKNINSIREGMTAQ